MGITLVGCHARTAGAAVGGSVTRRVNSRNIDHDHLVHIHVSPEQVPMELMRYTHGFPGHLNVILRSDMSNIDTHSGPTLKSLP